MKKLKFLVSLLVLVLPSIAYAQDSLLSLRNLYQREAQAADAGWMSRYNLAYIDLLILFNDPSGRMVPALLEESEKIIGKLGGDSSADRSEVEALKGLRYLAMMKLDPQQYGPRYSGALSEACAKALAINPDNPRAIIVRALYMKYMSAFMHQEYDPSEDLSRAGSLLDAQDSTGTAPVWGREFLAVR